MNYIYFGTATFSNIVINTLYTHGAPASVIVSQPDKPRGRGMKLMPTLVGMFALFQDTPLLRPQSLNDPQFLETIKNSEAKYCVVADYGKILPRELLGLPGKTFLCLHPSLLPAYRGPAPIQWALIKDEKTTGVSVFVVSDKIDAGDVLARKPSVISPEDDINTLSERLAVEGGLLLIEAIEKLEKGALAPIKQEESKASYFPKLTKEDGRIHWDKSASEINSLIRATLGWPSAYTSWQEKVLKVNLSEVLPLACDEPAGKIIALSDKGVDVACTQSVLRLKKVKPQDKAEMSAWAFACGHHLKVGDFFSSHVILR